MKKQINIFCYKVMSSELFYYSTTFNSMCNITKERSQTFVRTHVLVPNEKLGF